MGTDYALVHLTYTIPPAVGLTYLYRPLCTKLDVYKIAFLITIAVISTIPWDSYLIRHRIWTYPSNVIVGPTLLDIPLEEVFFFVIQTFNTSLLYLILNKSTLHSAYLQPAKTWRAWKWLGQLIFGGSIVAAAMAVHRGGEATYLGLIVVWAGPFLLLLWTLAYQLLIGLPATNTLLPIALPTLYLWIVDTLALRRGTWVIETGTKLGLHLWDGLEIEEAFFFLATNTLIVFGMAAFDNGLAILHAFPQLFATVPAWPSPVLLINALCTPATKYDMDRVLGLREAITRLMKKSRSFYLASGTFEGRVRIDLILLYSFCRVADDLVDEATSPDDAAAWVEKLRRYLDLRFEKTFDQEKLDRFIDDAFPAATRRPLRLLPHPYLSKQPLYDLLKGFDTDLQFSKGSSNPKRFPISDEKDLVVYGERVAGTVAMLCLDIIFHRHDSGTATKEQVLNAGNNMGVALQLVNIARDIAVDARIGRVYLPLTWLQEVELSPEAVLKNPEGTRINALRQRLLDHAFELHHQARGAIEELPSEVRGSIRVAVESYMEIGRTLRDKGYRVKAGRATVPKYRRVLVAWRALSK